MITSVGKIKGKLGGGRGIRQEASQIYSKVLKQQKESVFIGSTPILGASLITLVQFTKSHSMKLPFA